MSNPVLTKATDQQNWSHDPAETLQYPDVFLRTGLALLVTIASAVGGWMLLPQNMLIALVLGLAALGCAFWGIFRPGPLPTLLYAATQGGAAGIISSVFAYRYGADIVTTALIGTIIVFAVTLGVYLIPAVRSSGLGRRAFTIVIISYLLFSIASLVSGMFFGVGGGWGFFGMGALGIALSIGAVGLSAWSLLIDFGDVEDAIKAHAPRATGWMLALGLMISIIWVYYNLLRLLAILRR